VADLSAEDNQTPEEEETCQMFNVLIVELTDTSNPDALILIFSSSSSLTCQAMHVVQCIVMLAIAIKSSVNVSTGLVIPD